MKHIKEFDGLRGLLALWVFASHVIELGPYPGLAGPLRPNIAVDIFIILSGFVIFHLLHNGEDYRTFITRRWFRLFPVFALCFLLALALFVSLRIYDDTAFALHPDRKLLPHVFAHLTMLHGAVPEQWLPDTARAILPPAWSISVEWQFYLIAPLLFAFAMRPNWKVTCVFLALLGVRVLCEVGRQRAAVHGLAHGFTFNMQAFLPLKLEYFAVGAGSYAIWRWLAERNRPFHLPRLAYALLIPVVLLLAKKSPAMALWLGGMMALVNVHFGPGGGWVGAFSRLLNASPVQWLGQTSYCVYLLHVPALVLVRQVIVLTMPGLSAPALQAGLVLGGLAATLSGAWLLHTAVEQPMIRLGKRLTQSWKSIKPASASLPMAATP
jgi:peptidoglycan/LPS O-acetylase OafA/YrhL